MTPTEELGFELARGAFRYVAILALIGAMVALSLGFARNVFGIGTDDSDKSGRDRSGLRVHTDAKTGIQYLSTPDGGMTVRLDANGKPMREGGSK